MHGDASAPCTAPAAAQAPNLETALSCLLGVRSPQTREQEAGSKARPAWPQGEKQGPGQGRGRRSCGSRQVGEGVGRGTGEEKGGAGCGSHRLPPGQRATRRRGAAGGWGPRTDSWPSWGPAPRHLKPPPSVPGRSVGLAGMEQLPRCWRKPRGGELGPGPPAAGPRGCRDWALGRPRSWGERKPPDLSSDWPL